ncbi:hypothetical protein PLESTF_000539700 [Pleodorina starrii]|nr:hypothetical protein PLESTF_000539700 [Pleodorina starrii]
MRRPTPPRAIPSSILGLLPRLTSRQLVLLDPPVSYRGTFWFVSRFNPAALVTGVSEDAFLQLLDQDLLYINVHTTAYPGGAVRGTFKCKSPCRYT